jgi:hypothetical protein
MIRAVKNPAILDELVPAQYGRGAHRIFDEVEGRRRRTTELYLALAGLGMPIDIVASTKARFER